jgi:serine/threonine protein kinase
LQHLQQRTAPKPRLIHADLSLENLILTQQGVLKLIDFGVAREEQQQPSREQPALTPLSSWTPEDEQLTGLHQIGGKRTYVPPEGPPKLPTVQSDLYAAGVCAWELLSGWRFPILPAGLGAKEMGSLIAFAATGLPEPAWLLLQRCLHPDPQQRPDSAAQCLPILQRLHPDAGCGAPLGKLVSALLTTPDSTALPLPQAVEPLLAPLPFVETALRRLHDGFCAHQVLAIQPRSSEPSFAELTDGQLVLAAGPSGARLDHGIGADADPAAGAADRAALRLCRESVGNAVFPAAATHRADAADWPAPRPRSRLRPTGSEPAA